VNTAADPDSAVQPAKRGPTPGERRRGHLAINAKTGDVTRMGCPGLRGDRDLPESPSNPPAWRSAAEGAASWQRFIGPLRSYAWRGWDRRGRSPQRPVFMRDYG
jgi:hypothetical protein